MSQFVLWFLYWEKHVMLQGRLSPLHVLNFWLLKELEEWNVVEEAMPTLKKLEIRSCNSLKVPTGLGHLKTFSELKL